MNKLFYGFAVAATLVVGTAAQAAPVYVQSFETDTSGWSNALGGSITRVPSGTGGITSNTGNFHAVIGNENDSYDTGYGNAGYTFFGNTNTSAAQFSKSVAVFINVDTAAPTNPSVPAYWIDGALGNSNSATALGEHNFRLSYSGAAVSVGFDDQTPSVNIATSGWYTFQFLVDRSGPAAATSTTTLNVLMNNAIFGTSGALTNDFGGDLQNQNLSDPGYLWFTVWQNDFSRNQLAIDDVRLDAVDGAVPETATWAMMVAGFGLIGGTVRRRKVAVSFS